MQKIINLIRKKKKKLELKKKFFLLFFFFLISKICLVMVTQQVCWVICYPWPTECVLCRQTGADAPQVPLSFSHASDRFIILQSLSSTRLHDSLLHLARCHGRSISRHSDTPRGLPGADDITAGTRAHFSGVESVLLC